MIDAVVFDIGNVLAAFDWAGFLKNFGLDEQARREVARAVFQSEQWKQVDLGIMSDAALADAFVANAPHREKEIRAIFESWQYSVSEYPFAEAWVRELREKGYSVYVLSNYGRTMFNYAKERFGFLRHIDGGVISCEVNRIKPDPEIYRILIQKYSIIPEHSVFLDDLPDNVAAAEALGFKTVLVKDHESAVRGLRELGVG